MLAIAFWNIGKRQPASCAAPTLAADIAADPDLAGPLGEVILCLDEPGSADINRLAQETQALSSNHVWRSVQSSDSRFIYLTNISPSNIDERNEQVGCWPIRLNRSSTNGPRAYNLWFVHLESPVSKWNPFLTNTGAATDLRLACEAMENSAPLVTDSILIGDFNMDPYNLAMLDPRGMNAMMCRNLATKKATRWFGRPKRPYKGFYNPMWNLLGDRSTDKQPGSFYKGNDKTDAAIWHAIDQVLVRPTLIPQISAKSPKLLTQIGSSSLLSKSGIISGKGISDHLPVLITLNI